MRTARMATVATVTTGFALLSAAFLLASVAHASFPGRNGQIAYGLYRHSEPEQGSEEPYEDFPLGIEAISPGSAHQPSLRFSGDPLVPGQCIEAPSYSADGKLIAFDASWFGPECEPYPPPAAPLPPSQNIFLMSASGAEVHQVTKEAGVIDSDPGFSPSGDQIVFSRHANGQTQIYTIHSDGSDLQQLTTGSTGRDLSPRYSPDGNHIVFDSKNGIEEINADGSGRHILVADRGRYRVAEADISPTNKLITFVKATFSTSWIFIARANGRDARRLSPAAARDGSSCFHRYCADSPIFSPDGKRVLFVKYREYGGEGNSKLAEVPVTGRTRMMVQPIPPLNGGSTVVRPSWQPLP
jgi:WD40-like Beta Propeller Repeat